METSVPPPWKVLITFPGSLPPLKTFFFKKSDFFTVPKQKRRETRQWSPPFFFFFGNPGPPPFSQWENYFFSPPTLAENNSNQPRPKWSLFPLGTPGFFFLLEVRPPFKEKKLPPPFFFPKNLFFPRWPGPQGGGLFNAIPRPPQTFLFFPPGGFPPPTWLRSPRKPERRKIFGKKFSRPVPKFLSFPPPRTPPQRAKNSPPCLEERKKKKRKRTNEKSTFPGPPGPPPVFGISPSWGGKGLTAYPWGFFFWNRKKKAQETDLPPFLSFWVWGAFL